MVSGGGFYEKSFFGKAWALQIQTRPENKNPGGETMSVILFKKEEFIGLYYSILSLPSSEYALDFDEQELLAVMQSAHLANASAYSITYWETADIEIIDFSSHPKTLLSPAEIFIKIKSLLYNCISNGGRNYLPEKDHDFLKGTADLIAWKIIEKDIKN